MDEDTQQELKTHRHLDCEGIKAQGIPLFTLLGCDSSNWFCVTVNIWLYRTTDTNICYRKRGVKPTRKPGLTACEWSVQVGAKQGSVSSLELPPVKAFQSQQLKSPELGV